MASVVIIATLDTKGQETAFVKELIEGRGHDTLVMDAAVFPHERAADVRPEALAEAGGAELDELRRRADRGVAMHHMQLGVARVTRQLFEDGRLHAVLGLGGSGGTALATAGMRSLPVGPPKVMVSTVAAGDVGPYVGEKDIAMLYSVADLAGLNRLTRRVLGNAAGMVCGALEQAVPAGTEKALLAATMFGVTTPAVTKVQARLERHGYEVVVFHATGSGGRAMEELIGEGTFDAVCDLTTTELADELVGGVLSAGPDRLTGAGRAGVPQVVSVGALDMVNFWGPDTVPEAFRERRLYAHNANVTLMRTTPEENAALGEALARKLNAATGPVTLVLPLQGVSMIDAEGQAFYWPEADAALFEALRQHLDDKVKRVEVDANINDDAFADTFAAEVLTSLRARREQSSEGSG